MSDHDNGRLSIPAEIIQRFSKLETSGDCADLIASGYLDAMLSAGYFDDDTREALKWLAKAEPTEEEKDGFHHFYNYDILGGDYVIPDKHLHPEYKTIIKNINDSIISIDFLSILVYPVVTSKIVNNYRNGLKESLFELINSRVLRVADTKQEERFILGKVLNADVGNLRISMLQLRCLNGGKTLFNDYEKYFCLWKSFFSLSVKQGKQKSTGAAERYARWDADVVRLYNSGKLKKHTDIGGEIERLELSRDPDSEVKAATIIRRTRKTFQQLKGKKRQ